MVGSDVFSRTSLAAGELWLPREADCTSAAMRAGHATAALVDLIQLSPSESPGMARPAGSGGGGKPSRTRLLVERLGC